MAANFFLSKAKRTWYSVLSTVYTLVTYKNIKIKLNLILKQS